MEAIDRPPPRGLLLASMDVDPAKEAEFNRWYWEEHFPERLACPGFQWGARFRATDGPPRYLALYLLDNLEVLDGPAYGAIAGPSEWTRRILPHTTGLVRKTYEYLEPPTG
ncbi:hypothetical protein K7711_38125 [Nocardia sp. CA2R105]|uniref:DUF4286 family protein n=1 Tax=Nocardia coffeae TaxID=2873381 RepID=UPI001CA6A2DD|nr:DUF4286 family protein [Nocardia coffeae]MBY8862341.1 hypothetical protein [Nocardia coffeae]